MIVEVPTVAQAKKVAELTGGRHLPAKEEGKLSSRVEVADFEAVRGAVETVSVLFKLFSQGADGNLAEVPSGWLVTGAVFEAEWPKGASLVRSHFGARRFAFNWGLGLVKADMDARKADPDHKSTGWDLASLRKEWNQVKGEVAPWWAENSKESYSSGLADLAVALKNWRGAKDGERKGKKVGFPRFSSKHRDHGRVRFTTGTMRFEPDRRTITLPVVGALRSKENTRRVERHLSAGRARLLSMTLSERWGRLFVSANYAVRTSTPRPVAKPDERAGVDLGLRVLATVADTEDNIIEFPNPAPLRGTMAERRKTGRQLSRRIPGSKGHGQAKAKLARLDRRAVHLRAEGWHQLTSWLAATYGEVVGEDLDIAAMRRSMGRRAFRRAVSDAALGSFRPMVAYKTRWSGTRATWADRWYPSSQLHHGCGCRLAAPTKLAKYLSCRVTGEKVDRDVNAAKNLRDWPGDASPRSVGASAPVVSSPARGGRDAGSGTESTRRRGSRRKAQVYIPRAARREARTKTSPATGQGTPQGDAA